MSFSKTIVVFTLNDQEHALPLSIVESVVRSVEVTKAPNAPELMMGLINFRGEIIPVINTRRCFGHPDRPLSVHDRFIIASVNHRKMAVWHFYRTNTRNRFLLPCRAQMDSILQFLGYPSFYSFDFKFYKMNYNVIIFNQARGAYFISVLNYSTYLM